MTTGHTIEEFVDDEAAFDAVLFNLQVTGETIKMLPAGRCSPRQTAAGRLGRAI